MSYQTTEYARDATVVVRVNSFDLDDYQVDLRAGGCATWRCPRCLHYAVTLSKYHTYMCHFCQFKAGHLVFLEDVRMSELIVMDIHSTPCDVTDCAGGAKCNG